MIPNLSNSTTSPMSTSTTAPSEMPPVTLDQPFKSNKTPKTSSSKIALSRLTGQDSMEDQSTLTKIARI